jgi:GDP-L-fucose synthase
MDTILVTGGTGLLGKSLENVVDKKKYNWIFLSSKDGDLRIESDTLKIFELHKPVYVFHLAANVGGLFKNIKYPTEIFHDNVLINENVLKACHLFKVKKVIACASSCIFPANPRSYPMTENMILEGDPHPTNASYSWSKRLMIFQANNYIQQYGMNIITVNPVNLYGPNDSIDLQDSHIIPAVIQKIITAKNTNLPSVTIFGTGRPLRQFLYVDDCARMLVLIFESNENISIINFSNNEMSINNCVEIIAKNIGYTGTIEYDITKSDGVYRKTISNSLFLSLFPSFEFTSFDKGITKTLEWFYSKKL